jgi:hypothetical protein
VGYLREYVRRPALEVIAEALARYAVPETARNLLVAYEAFLGQIDDPATRQHLEDLPPAGAETDAVFQEFQRISRDFQTAL